MSDRPPELCPFKNTSLVLGSSFPLITFVVLRSNFTIIPISFPLLPSNILLIFPLPPFLPPQLLLLLPNLRQPFPNLCRSPQILVQVLYNIHPRPHTLSNPASIRLSPISTIILPPRLIPSSLPLKLRHNNFLPLRFLIPVLYISI